MKNYEEIANEFAEKNGLTLEVLDTNYRTYFFTDKEERWVFKMRIKRNRKSYTFDFGQSQVKGS